MKEILILILALPVLLFYKEDNDDNTYYDAELNPPENNELNNNK